MPVIFTLKKYHQLHILKFGVNYSNQVGCGGASVDFLATVASYPNPDDKIRSLNLKVRPLNEIQDTTKESSKQFPERVLSKNLTETGGFVRFVPSVNSNTLTMLS